MLRETTVLIINIKEQKKRMLFNSIDFAIFLPIVFILYWFVANKNLKLQNFLIVAASYLFYGWWDWRFLSLILFSTIVDFTIGQKLRNEENQLRRKVLLWTNSVLNVQKILKERGKVFVSQINFELHNNNHPSLWQI